MCAWRRLVLFSSVSCMLLSCKRGSHVPSPEESPGGQWYSSVIEFHIDPSGLQRLPYEIVESTAVAAAQAWASDECLVPRIQIGKPVENFRARRDGQNMIILRSNVWARDGRPDNGYYSPEAVALTTSYPLSDAAAARVSEVDIELNAVQYRWGDAKAVGSGNCRDLQAAFTHEFGHALGLRDNCVRSLPARSDSHGSSACSVVSADLMMAAMYPVGAPGQTTQRHPSKSERDALCAIYRR
jgi:hypothetical protein